MKQSWKIVVAFIVVFLAGGAIAFVLTLRFTVPQVQPKPSLAPENFNPQLMRRWINANQFNLTPAQKERIRPIVTDTAEDLRRLSRENLRGEELILEHMQDEIAAILNPAQRNQFNDLIQAKRSEMQKFRQQQQLRALQ